MLDLYMDQTNLSLPLSLQAYYLYRKSDTYIINTQYNVIAYIINKQYNVIALK